MEVSCPGGSLLAIVVGFTGLFMISMGTKSTNTERVQGQVKFRPSAGTQKIHHTNYSLSLFLNGLLPTGTTTSVYLTDTL